jgi:hypothetical protein
MGGWVVKLPLLVTEVLPIVCYTSPFAPGWWGLDSMQQTEGLLPSSTCSSQVDLRAAPDACAGTRVHQWLGVCGR